MFDLDVVVVGGGIAGLSTALFLHRFGFRVRVYERAPEILPVGAAISVWSNGVKVLNRLGLGRETAAMGGRMERMTYRAHDSGAVLLEEPLRFVYEEAGERCYPVPRAELQQLLMDTFVREGGNLTLGRSLERVREDGPSGRPVAVFDDGSEAGPCDLLVGADGIRSAVRAHVLGAEDPPLVYHYTNWNGLVPMRPDLGNPDEWVMYVGEGKRASLMPVGGGRYYFFLGAPLPEDAPAPPRGSEEMRAELQQVFSGWPEQVQRLLAAIDVQGSLNRIPICDVDPLPRLWRGRCVLVGDAAHATTPTLGQGGCQAMEDAEVLAAFLTTTNVGVEDALRRYQQHREHRVREMVVKARERTATIYPRTDAQRAETDKWYRELKEDKELGKRILRGIASNLQQGPWPPRL